ncbi:MAG: ATP-binding protein [Spirochaetes bacterium]|nr:ATP-binding protein [Spirochaetota bacterium]
MLIQFSVTNYKSIKNTLTLDMSATAFKEHKNKNIFPVLRGKLDLLKSACIYGPNASGKSNFIRAMKNVRDMVLRSAGTQVGDIIPVVNFKLSSETENAPSKFEVCFVIEGRLYRYGFSVDRAMVHSEWLYGVINKKEVKFFQRKKDRIKVSSHFKEGILLIDKTRPNALFLSVVAQFNGEISKEILNWFRKLVVIRGVVDDYKSIEKAKNKDLKDVLLSFLKAADLGIEDIEIKEKKILGVEDLPKGVPIHIKKQILSSEDAFVVNKFSMHNKYNLNGKKVGQRIFPFSYESKGTQKVFALFSYLYDSLNSGFPVVIDELEAGLHPMVVEWIVGLFNSLENKNNAQIIFASHNTNILDKKYFRRDQIWFMEKDKYGASKLFSLAEYGSKVRNDASFAKDYMFGKYGAVPIIKKFTGVK